MSFVLYRAIQSLAAHILLLAFNTPLLSIVLTEKQVGHKTKNPERAKNSV